jgi:glucose-6-phosphate isomerase
MARPKSTASPAFRPDRTPEWAALRREAKRLGRTSLAALFGHDRRRAASLTVEALGLRVDLSKQLLDRAVLARLLALAKAAGVAGRRRAMFAGERINVTEGRAALHVALRAPRSARIALDGENVVPKVHATLDRMAAFSRAVRSGRWKGHTGKPIRNVVNVGIGGSDLGPVMAAEALEAWTDHRRTHRFVSNVDPADLTRKLRGLDPAETLFIIASKTFTTAETMANAEAARRWSLAAFGGDRRSVARHFVAVSTEERLVREFGIDPANMFGFWEWVGGRYSMDSAIGLSTMLAIGPDGFREMLTGFREMDEHFLEAPAARNLPTLLALVGIWNRNFLGHATHAVLPYSQALSRFPAYLQQLEMESNGKRNGLDGKPVTWDTAPVLWGEPGTNGQHSFYQMLHQGTTVVPCDILAFLRPEPGLPATGSMHVQLLATAFAQAEAMAFGQTAAQAIAAGSPRGLAPFRTFPGNRPTTLILGDALSPRMLGRLVALYEHKTFVQGVIWGIDSFDQWGVELGKTLAKRILPALEGKRTGVAHDGSTAAAIAAARKAARRR